MYNYLTRCELVVDFISTTFEINLCKMNSLNINNLTLDIVCDKNILNLSLSNNSDSIITLNKLQMKLMTILNDDYTSYLINNENPLKSIDVVNLKNAKNKKVNFSHLYTVFFTEPESTSKIIGFLSSFSSKNYIEILQEKENSNIYAVYDFINHKLEPNEKLNLDSIYTNHSRTYSQLFNSYTENIPKNFTINNITTDNSIINKTIKSNLLFTDTVIDETLRIKRNPIYIKLENKQYYLINITSIQGKKFIFKKCTELMDNTKCNIIHIKNIISYIEKITELKCFNVYLELNNLLNILKSSKNHLELSFEDCPLGLAVGNFDIINNTINFNKSKSIFKNFVVKENINSLNYDFILKTLFQNSLFKHNTYFKIDNSKIKELLEIISLNDQLSEINDKFLIKALDDFDANHPIILTHKNKDVFSFLRFGKQCIYLAIFNLSKSSTEFFLNLAFYGNCNLKNGTAVDILTNTDYLLSDNKIYIKKLNPKECIFIKKDICNDEILKTAN